MLIEACIENLTRLRDKEIVKADRIELCDNLAVGGTTPSIGVVDIALSMSNDLGIAVAPIIRARGGDFVYDDFEKKGGVKKLP